MLKQLKQTLRDVSVWFFRLVGSEIRDWRTRKRLGRGLVFWWGGRLHLLDCNCALVPFPIPQKRLTYWKQSISFTAHPEVDFSSAHSVSAALGEPKSILLNHRDPASVEKTISLWKKVGFDIESLLLAYAGGRDSFDKMSGHNMDQVVGMALKEFENVRLNT
jgi:hypothetical protein